MTRLSISLTAPVPKAKSKATQISELLPEIEAALAAGHSHEAIFENIKKTIGLDLTFGYYKNTLHRVRQRQEPKDRIVAMSPALRGSKSAAIPVSPIKTQQNINAPTSKVQATLGEPVDDFFS